jgi:hypothetical protein
VFPIRQTLFEVLLLNWTMMRPLVVLFAAERTGSIALHNG